MDLIVNVILVPSKKYPTLKKAVTQASAPFAGDKTNRVTTIVVGEGEHLIDGNYLEIPSTMKIVGDSRVPKEKIVVMGGIWWNALQGNLHLQHLTLRQAKQHGVWGCSSFTMDDVVVERSTFSGVFVMDTGVVGRCTNVEVRFCKWSGVLVNRGASMTLVGPNTKVHDNCTGGITTSYGLSVSANSSIQLVSPLTKETVSINNGGGGNWGGDINQIVTVPLQNDEVILVPLMKTFVVKSPRTLQQRLAPVPTAKTPNAPPSVRVPKRWVKAIVSPTPKKSPKTAPTAKTPNAPPSVRVPKRWVKATVSSTPKKSPKTL